MGHRSRLHQSTPRSRTHDILPAAQLFGPWHPGTDGASRPTSRCVEGHPLPPHYHQRMIPGDTVAHMLPAMRTGFQSAQKRSTRKLQRHAMESGMDREEALAWALREGGSAPSTAAGCPAYTPMEWAAPPTKLMPSYHAGDQPSDGTPTAGAAYQPHRGAAGGSWEGKEPEAPAPPPTVHPEVQARRDEAMPNVADIPVPILENYLTQLFQIADANDDGVLDPDEFEDLMSMSGFNFSPSTVKKMMDSADVNHDGVIEWKEFLPLALELSRTQAV